MKQQTKKQEEGRRTTTKSERTSTSSHTNATAEHKKVIDAEEEQRKKRIEDDSKRLDVNCRIFGDDIIRKVVERTGSGTDFGMIAQTAAGAARRILLRAADKLEWTPEIFANTFMEIHIRFEEPVFYKAVIKEDGDDVKD